MSEQDGTGLEQGGSDDASRQSKQSAQLGCCLARGSWTRRNVYQESTACRSIFPRQCRPERWHPAFCYFSQSMIYSAWFNKSEVVEETNVEDNKSTNVKKTVKSGITFGSALAMVISYTTWKSVGWAIFHGLLSWVYVIYFLLRY